eukprot:2363573-Prymnesium_polylepis.1
MPQASVWCTAQAAEGVLYTLSAPIWFHPLIYEWVRVWSKTRKLRHPGHLGLDHVSPAPARQPGGGTGPSNPTGVCVQGLPPSLTLPLPQHPSPVTPSRAAATAAAGPPAARDISLSSSWRAFATNARNSIEGRHPAERGLSS